MSTRDVGDRVNVQYLAYANGAASSATVAFTVTDPAGATTTPTPTFSAPNQYDASFLLNAAGPWSWRWDVTGLVEDVSDGSVLAAHPAPPAYAPLSVLKSNLNIAETDTDRDDLLQQKLLSASRAVEKYCDNRRFYLAPVATQRTFSTGRRVVCRRDGTMLLNIDDVGTSTLVVEVGNGTTWTAFTGFETYPDNALAKQDAITGLVTTGSEWSSNRRVRITARWGWPDVPAAVYEATLLQAMRLFRRKDSPEGVAGSADWGLVRVPNLDPDVKAQLAYLTNQFQAA